MSITDELREYASGWKDRSCHEHLLAIADRIDAEHEKMLRKVAESLTTTYEDMEEDGWVRLPVDADGVPIHVGDAIEIEHNGRVTTVTNINYNEHGWQVYCAEGGGFDKDTRCHHTQPDSWERIIGDAANLVRGDNESVVELVERCRRLAGAE